MINTNILPSVAMMYDGVFFEEMIEGYQTVKVIGRENSVIEHSSEPIYFGSIITKESVTPRKITVEFMISTENTSDFQIKIKKLTKLLYKNEDQTIVFADDINTIFYGRFESFSEFTDYKNAVVGSFTIYCQDPLKYGPVIETTGAVTIDPMIDTTPERIIVDVPETISGFQITNGRETIRIEGNINAGSEVILYLKDQKMTVNGTDSVYMIALNSDFENFYVRSGDTVTSTVGTLKLFMRERWL